MLLRKSIEYYVKNNSLNSYVIISILFFLFTIISTSFYYFNKSFNYRYYEDLLNERKSIIFLKEIQVNLDAYNAIHSDLKVPTNSEKVLSLEQKAVEPFLQNENCFFLNSKISNSNIVISKNNVEIYRKNVKQCLDYIDEVYDQNVIKFKENSRNIYYIEIVLIFIFFSLLVSFVMYGYFITNTLDKLIKNKLLFSKIDLTVANSESLSHAIEKIMKIIAIRMGFKMGIYWEMNENNLVYKGIYSKKIELKKFILENKLNLIERMNVPKIYDGENNIKSDENIIGNKLYSNFSIRRRILIPLMYDGKYYGLYEFFGKNYIGVFQEVNLSLYHKISNYLGRLFYKNNSSVELSETRNLLEQQRFALDASAIVAITDIKGTIKYVNDKFCEISGYSREELIGFNHRKINSGFHSKEFFKDLWKTILSGKVWHSEVRNKRKNGLFYWVDSTIVPIFNAENRIIQFIAIRFDITQKKEMEEGLFKAKEEAENLARSKGWFISTMSHEIRTPLNVILGMVNLLSDEIKNEKSKKYFEVINITGNNLITILNDILDFSKLDDHKLELEKISFNLNDTIQECVSMFGIKAQEKNLILNTDIDENLPKWILGDPVRVKQVLINLLSNAIKFTDKGSIVVQTRVLVEEQNSYLIKISVIDTGIGLKPESLNKIFFSFSQADGSTNRKYGGTGLGLAICKGISKAMGGDIFVKSSYGEGSTFSFAFKAIAGEPTQIVQKEPYIDSKMAIKFPLNILVADDSVNNQFIMCKFLEKLGYTPDIANNGNEVLQIVNSKKYDVIFMDCYMPELNGFETTQKIYQTYQKKNLPWIIALTANVSNEDQIKCKETGMHDFIGKPFNMERIIESLNRLISNREISENIEDDSNFNDISLENYFIALDKDKILTHFSDDWQILSRYIELFFVYFPKMIISIDESIERKESKNIEITTHKLKGNVGSFFVNDIVNDLQILEDMGRNEDYKGAKKLFIKVKGKLNALLLALKNLLETKT
ncbi:PAS domain-containing hybrid sensor histidine kinase/response regulator [Fluviispira vulneris]|uniref:PAS domain-containing hybrid sensor histidine kinase/response regulator n=1 Tax=Fluviispira vulneris TaxID=2763012 RepID=UPI001648B68C|nr:ATP-binding protein [Fluviispira vulneris]